MPAILITKKLAQQVQVMASQSGVGYRFVSLGLLLAAIALFCVWKSCKSGNGIVKEGKRSGLATTITLS